MTAAEEFNYRPNEYEAEKASNAYLMSLIAIMVGLPLPIINLVATFFYYLGNRKQSYFIRFHCLQALLPQVLIVIMNARGFWWTLSILFGPVEVTDSYIAYILTIAAFNIVDFIFTIITAIKVRKGEHVEWWLFGPLTHAICKP
jgi:uncharacterized Tic20 family protein